MGDLDNTIVSENENCSKKTRNCGYIDTLQNKLCIKKNDKCPINYISIDNVKSDDVKITKTIEGTGRNIYISNNPYSHQNDTRIPEVIGNFKLANDKICPIPYLYYSEYKLYTLDANLNKSSKDCIILIYNQTYRWYENRYQQLDSIQIYDLYQENNILDVINRSELINNGYDIEKYFKNKDLYLYYKNLLGLIKLV